MQTAAAEPTPAESATEPATAELNATDNPVAEAEQSAEALAEGGVHWLEERIIDVAPFYQDAPLLQAFTVVLLFTIAASFSSWFLKRVVASWFKKTQTDLDDHLLSAMTPAIYTTVIALGVRVGFGRLGFSSQTSERTADALATLVVLVWVVALFQISSRLLVALANNRRIEFVRRRTVPLFDNLAKIIIFGIAAYSILSIWEADISGLLAAGGIVGLAVGFAAKDTLANLFAGIFIFADSPYSIGDFINLDSGERGMVTEIGIRSTRLLTRDDVQVTIPNAVMGNAKIVNETGGPHMKYRIRVKIGAAYGSDIDRVREVLLEVAANESLVCAEPAPRVRFRTFGASSLDFELLCWVEEPVLRGRALDQLNCATYKAFIAADLEIPYSKHDLYIKEMPSTWAGEEGAASGADG